uniref:Diphosphomevalonate decarboxylase n=1 Tax=Steinernema glaseri TaxID=37863 RepID=A0A1I7Y744_9BILA
MVISTPDSAEFRKEVVVSAPINIALIKYWGKRDELRMLPLNDSVSLTVDSLCAKTRIRVGGSVEADSVRINGVDYDMTSQKRFWKCFAEARKIRSERSGEDTTEECFEVVSKTNFPVAAGLASSAAGFAAIAYALGKLYDFSEEEVARLARMGSGSACRSVFDGLVHWKAGEGEETSVEKAAENWPELRAIILVTSEKEKAVGSSVGMRLTVQTSELLKYRVSHVVPERVKGLVEAYKNRDFPKLGEIIMADSNQLHAVCLDTRPPLRYMNDSSWHIVSIVEAFNSTSFRAAYSFDAGSNACIFIQDKDVGAFLATVAKYAQFSEDLKSSLPEAGSVEAQHLLNVEPKDCSITSVIVSTVGRGPTVIDNLDAGDC